MDARCKNSNCHRLFVIKSKGQKYCSLACAYSDRKSNKIKKSCEFCGKDVLIFPSRDDGRHHFCNTDCLNNWQKQYHKGSNNPSWKGIRTPVDCKQCGKVFIRRTRQSKFCSDACRIEYLTKTQKKDKHPSWKGGVTKERRVLESSTEYKEWRRQVFMRDKYQCAVCGKKGKLDAHHIKTFADYPKLRTEVSNGITLCKSCHRQVHFKEPNFEQYFDFLVCKAEVHGLTT